MNKSQKIELLKVRDISSILVDTFSFVKANFKSLFSGIFYICSPTLLICGIGAFLFFNNYFNTIFPTITKQVSEYSYASNIPENFLLLIPYMLLFLLVAFLALSFIFTVSLCYVKLYKNKEKISTPILWKLTRKYIGKIIGAQVILLLAAIIAYMICFLSFRMNIAAISVLLFLIFFIGIFYFPIKLLFTSIFIILEDKGIIESFKFSYQFTKGIFWKVFLFMFLMSLIIYLFMYLFQLPGLILSYFNLFMGVINQNSSDNSFPILLGSALTGLGSALGYSVYSIYYIGLSIFYYSTVEKRTGMAANAEIEDIGKNDTFE